MLSTCLYTFWVRPRNLDLLCPGPCAVYCFIVRNSAIILDLSYCALTLYCRVAPEVLMTSDVAPGGSVVLWNVSWALDSLDSRIPRTLCYNVMNNAPFNVLLGRPFFQAGRCRTTNFANGEQHITLTDPRTKADVTIPTHARSREGFHVSRN